MAPSKNILVLAQTSEEIAKKVIDEMCGSSWEYNTGKGAIIRTPHDYPFDVTFTHGLLSKQQPLQVNDDVAMILLAIDVSMYQENIAKFLDNITAQIDFIRKNSADKPISVIGINTKFLTSQEEDSFFSIMGSLEKSRSITYNHVEPSPLPGLLPLISSQEEKDKHLGTLISFGEKEMDRLFAYHMMRPGSPFYPTGRSDAADKNYQKTLSSSTIPRKKS